MILFKCELITVIVWSLSPSGLIKPHDSFSTAVDGHAAVYLSKNTENLCCLFHLLEIFQLQVNFS